MGQDVSDLLPVQGLDNNTQSLLDALQGNDPSWYRSDGTKKGMGFLGPLKTANGKVATEISVGVNIGGKDMDIPTLVPTLNPKEINHLLLGNAPTTEIVNKAVLHAKMRLSQGKSVFAD